MTSIFDSVYRAQTPMKCAVALSAVLALGLGASAAHGQIIDYHENPSAARSDSLAQTASYNGYSTGYARGAGDAKSATDFQPQHDRIFQQATSGYSADLGSVEQYQSDFRRAYENGYSDGYHGRERNLASLIPPVTLGPNSEPGGSSRDLFGVAATNGYNAGYKYGAAASKGGASFEYHHDAIYQSATEGFGVDMGGRIPYQATFRQGYSRGFSDGFNGRVHVPDAGQAYGRVERWDPPSPRIMSRSDITRLAAATGYHEGFERGASDKSAGQSFGFRRNELYRQATTGYDQSWDMQRGYQDAFREGYVLGYGDGYRRRSPNRTYEDTYNQHRDPPSGDGGESHRSHEDQRQD